MNVASLTSHRRDPAADRARKVPLCVWLMSPISFEALLSDDGFIVGTMPLRFEAVFDARAAALYKRYLRTSFANMLFETS
jgi:hypothetical protein